MANFILELRGNKVGTQSVPIGILGKYLTELQAILGDIARATLPFPKEPTRKREFIENLQVNATALTNGSTKVVIDLPNQTTLTGKLPIISALENFLSMIDLIQEPVEDDAHNTFVSKIGDYFDRIRILNHYKALWDVKGAEAAFLVDGGLNFPKNRYEMPNSFVGRVVKWLKEDLAMVTTSYRGVITRIKADGKPRHFSLINERGQVVECQYSPEQEVDILALIKTPVLITGVAQERQAKKVIKSLTGIEAVNSIKFTPDDSPLLVEPVEFAIDYDKKGDLWIAENETLGMRLVSNLYDGLRKEFALHLDFIVDRYLIQGEDNVSPQLQEAVGEIAKIVDISKRPPTEKHWESAPN